MSKFGASPLGLNCKGESLRSRSDNALLAPPQNILSGAKSAALDLLGRRALHILARRGFRLICLNSARVDSTR